MASATNRAGRIATAALTFALGAGLLYLAVPRALAVFFGLPGEPVLSRIQEGRSVTHEDLEVLIASRRRALGWVQSGRLYTDLGLAQLMLSDSRGGAGGFERTLLADSIVSLRRGLILAPARPHAWTRLAYAELAAEGSRATVAQALEMALITAPYEPKLLFARLELCLLAWASLSDEAGARTYDQIRLAWKQDPKRLVALARGMGRANIVRSALVSSLAALVRFNRRYQEAPGA